MGAQNTAQGSAAVRFAPYIEELQEFFASACLRYGSPEDIIAVTERIESSQAFAEDLGSMIRSIVLREGGELAHSQLLETLAIAIGGPKMDHAPQQYGQPLRNLLSFMTGVLRKPWNEPPDDVIRVERAEVLPFPTKARPASERGHGQAAAISAATDRARHAELAKPLAASADQAHSEDGKRDSLDNSLKQRKVPDVVGEPTPAPTSALDPESPARDAIDDIDLSGDCIDDASSASVPVVRPGARPVSALTEAAETAAVSKPLAGLDAAKADVPVPAANAVRVPPPVAEDAGAAAASWQVAARAVRSGAEPLWDSKGRVQDSNTGVAESSARAAPSEPVGRQPKPVAPTTAMPAIKSVPAPGQIAFATAASSSQISDAQADAARSRYSPRVPRTPSGILVVGAAVLVVAGIFAASLHRTPTELTGKQGPIGPARSTPPHSTNAGIQRASAAAAPSSVPAGAAGPAAAAQARMRRVAVAEDEDVDERGVAAPYSTPVPGQPETKPTAYGPAVSPASSPATAQRSGAMTRPPSDEVASTASGPQQLGAAYGGRVPSESYAGGASAYRPQVRTYRNPDAAIAGDLPRASNRGSRGVVSGRADELEISSGVMAGNLISAPRPDYPTLARIAHIGGEVILQAVIAKNGTVSATRVLSGHRLLRGAAQDAVRQWRYRPYVMDGHPVEVSTIITVRFKPKG